MAEKEKVIKNENAPQGKGKGCLGFFRSHRYNRGHRLGVFRRSIVHGRRKRKI